VHTLRLGPVLTSRVGSNTERGISGGELKRLNIATELLAQPQLLFLDEPLSGLDSSLATLVLHALSTDAATRSTTILLSVHQPSASMWYHFADLMLMAPGGHTAYFGNAQAAQAHVASAMGVARPPHVSDAEWLMDIVSGLRHDAPTDGLLASFAACPAPPHPPRGRAIHVPARPPIHVATLALLRRGSADRLRAERKRFEVMVTVGLAAIFAGVFFQVGAHRLERQRDYVSILFFFVAHWSWYPLFKTMGAYPTQRDVLTRERASDSYAIAAWSMAHVLGEWSTAWMHPLLFYIVAYPLAALPVRAFPSLFVINMINLEVRGRDVT